MSSVTFYNGIQPTYMATILSMPSLDSSIHTYWKMRGYNFTLNRYETWIVRDAPTIYTGFDMIDGYTAVVPENGRIVNDLVIICSWQDK